VRAERPSIAGPDLDRVRVDVEVEVEIRVFRKHVDVTGDLQRTAKLETVTIDVEVVQVCVHVAELDERIIERALGIRRSGDTQCRDRCKDQTLAHSVSVVLETY